MDVLPSSPFDLSALHQELFRRLRKLNVHLQAIAPSHTVTDSAAVPTVTYLRLPAEAQAVEQLIKLQPQTSINLRHHPVIELRLTEHWLTLELVLNPEAWYDQRNWLGKLGIKRYRDEFYGMVSAFNPHMRIGSWAGIHPAEPYLTSAQLKHPRVFEAWVSTFSDGRDWLRVGVWYAVEPDTIGIVDGLYAHAQTLYQLYQYMAWTGRNDFYWLFQKTREGTARD
jgi:hypothetical protein